MRILMLIFFPFASFAQIHINGTGEPVHINGIGSLVSINKHITGENRTIFNSASESFIDGFDYTADSELAVTASQIEYSGTTTKTLDLLYNGNNLYHQYEKWRVTTTVVLGAMASGQNGFMIGVKSSNGGAFTGFHIKCGATANTWAIQPMQNSSAAGAATTGHAYAPGAAIEITVTRTVDVFEITIDDGTTPVTASIDYSTWAYALPAIITEFSITFYTGTFTITDYHAVLPEFGITCAFLGNSVTQGQNADTYDSAYPQRLKSIFSDGQSFAGRSSKTADLLLTLPAIALLAPEKVTLMIGINDLLTSVPLETIQANYAAIVAGLQSYGIEVILLSILPNGTNAMTMNSWMQSTYPSLQYIDLWSALKSPSTINMDTTYSSDGVHPNEAGHLKIYETFLNEYQ